MGLILVQGVYLLGVGPLRERYDLAESVEPRQAATFSAGILVIFFAILSPLHVLACRGIRGAWHYRYPHRSLHGQVHSRGDVLHAPEV